MLIPCHRTDFLTRTKRELQRKETIPRCNTDFSFIYTHRERERNLCSSGSMEMPLIDRRPDALGDLRVVPDEILCAILENLTPRDIARLSCVSSVMYILCNEEPLWMHLCLSSVGGLLRYKNSWKETAIHHHHLSKEYAELCRKPLHFDGFNSMFLYRRWYRCFTSLDAFSVDRGYMERKVDLSLEEFHSKYDGKKPVLLTELAKNWPARSTWTIDLLLQNVGDIAFRLSQRGTRKITMKFKDYVEYTSIQHDEDPLYIFDDKFGDVAPSLLKDYSVPHLFQEDLFELLDTDQRPPFRWLIIGPERSGASWHVDPALTSAWNTLLYGRKRWALYPPGKVPLGVTVHVSEEDGDVNIETPSSLQWWLDIYPFLAEHDKPLECTQLPGETIFVPSGWWHCVLNLETSIAVTQNFVNTSNFEFVCLDMAPGYRHRGVCRAGQLAIHGNVLENIKKDESCDIDQSDFPDMTRERKRLKISRPRKHPFLDGSEKKAINDGSSSPRFSQNKEFSYTIDYLSMFLEEDRDHYTSVWSPSNCIGQREFREWLQKLWVKKPRIRELVWKGACIALNADMWLERMMEICASHNFPSPSNDERLPVGTGSNPVYLVGDQVIKIYVEGGLESSINSLGTELEFYGLLHKVKSPLRDHVPDILASGILFYENGSYRTVPWDGKGVPDAICKCNIICESCPEDGFSFGVWSKKQFEVRKAGLPVNGLANSGACASIWPYIIMRRCKGDIFAHLRDRLPRDDVLELASFLGNQLSKLHLLPLPSFYNPCNANALSSEVKKGQRFTKTLFNDIDNCSEVVPSANASTEPAYPRSSIPEEWLLFIETMNRRKNDIVSRLTKWGDPIPSILIEKVDEYVPHDFSVLLNVSKDDDGMVKVSKSPTWIHSDIMDDNVQMEPCLPTHFLEDNAPDGGLKDIAVEGYIGDMKQRKWHAKYILDFSDVSIGDPLCDLIPIYLDIFRGDSKLLKHFLDSYKLPLRMNPAQSKMCLNGSEESRKKERISYLAMCYCILHEENVMGAIFSLWKELRMAKSWEEIEETVWGELNYYQSSC